VAQDDTVGFGYFSLLESVGGEVPAPDIVVSSLSKVFSGVGNAMGGALTLNAMSPNYGELKALMDEQFELMLAEADAGKCDLEAIFTSFDRLCKEEGVGRGGLSTVRPGGGGVARVATLLHNASDLRRRLAVVSENATALVAWLRAQPAVAVRELCTVKKLPNECLLVAVGMSRHTDVWLAYGIMSGI
jgi:O-acetylhomoserine/O-acetylserine sulfhydrylase-like pyridoxal-dependent enzyme